MLFFYSNKILLSADILHILKFWKQKLIWQQRDSNLVEALLSV